MEVGPYPTAWAMPYRAAPGAGTTGPRELEPGAVPLGPCPGYRMPPAGRTSHSVHSGANPARGQNTEDSGLGGL